MNKNKGFTLVEVIVSVVLIMSVMFYLLRTIIVTSNKSNELLTLQEYSVYENNLLNTFYKDVDSKITNIDKLKGVMPDTSDVNTIHFLDMNNVDLKIDPSQDRIIYNNVVYKMPNNVKLMQKNGKYYSVDYVDSIYDDTSIIIINIYVKVYNKDEIIKLMYQGTMDQGEGHTVTCHWNNANGTQPEDVKTVKVAHGRPLYESMCGSYSNGAYAKEGWYTAATGGTKREFPITVEGDLNIYVHWAETGFTIVFNSNSGSGSMSNVYVPMNSSGGTSAVTLPKNNGSIYKTGSTFTGWNTKADGSGTAYLDNSTFPSLSSTQLQNVINNMDGVFTLYAQWEASINYVNIKINANGGSLVSHGDAYNISNGYITKNGSTIIHKIKWGESIDSNGLINYNNANTIKLSKTGYDVESNDKIYYMGSGSSRKYFNQDTGYAASEFCDASTASCDVILYVNWAPATYGVTLSKNGGSGGTNTIYEKYNTGFYTDSATTKKMTNTANKITPPTRRGYTFNGYYVGSDCTGKKFIDENGYLIPANASTKTFTSSSGALYACWIGIKYTIRYHGNGGVYNDGGTNVTTWTDNRKFTYGNTYTGKNAIVYTNNNFFIRNGYTFTTWKTSNGSEWEAGYPNSGSTIWAWIDGEFGIGAQEEHVVDLYAQWSLSPYILTLGPNSGIYNGRSSASTKSMTLNSTDNNSIGAATKEGYSFKGWYTTKGEHNYSDTWGTQVYNSSGVAIANTTYFTSDKKWKYSNNLTLYAHYFPNTYKITFNGNGGSWSCSGQYCSGVSNPANIVYDTHRTTIGTWDNPNSVRNASYYKVSEGMKATKASTSSYRYVFDGYWTDSSAGVEVFDSNGDAVTGDYWGTTISESGDDGYLLWKYPGSVTLYAHWVSVPISGGSPSSGSTSSTTYCIKSWNLSGNWCRYTNYFSKSSNYGVSTYQRTAQNFCNTACKNQYSNNSYIKSNGCNSSTVTATCDEYTGKCVCAIRVK